MSDKYVWNWGGRFCHIFDLLITIFWGIAINLKFQNSQATLFIFNITLLSTPLHIQSTFIFLYDVTGQKRRSPQWD